MHVRVLGEIEVVGDEPIALGGPTQRRVLAALALHRGEVVSVPYLIGVVWPEREPPDRAEHNVRTYVHRLRASLADDGERVETVGAGYRLRLDVDELDAARFEQLADVANRLAATGDTIRALEQITEAEGLWRGRPLNGFEDEPWAVPIAVRLREKRANLRERRAAALIEVGRPLEAIEGLEELLHDEPLRERPRALLMRALYESGRQAEALRAFQEFRALLIDEIGVEPSSELVALDRSIALGDLPITAVQPRRVGAYELHERIGEGAFAIVYRATQPSLGRDVAVKIIRAELANQAQFIRRFEAEAQMVARIEHSNVVPLYDYWREPDRAFLTMRWMTGGSLKDRLDGSPWSLDAIVALVDQIAAALGAAHRQGVVHRDVKPENILFDAEGRAYLGDFGIALDADDRSHPETTALTHSSPNFASPEQLRCEPVGPEADIYALAMVTFALLTGRTPFADSPDAATVLQRQLHEPIPRARTFRSDVPERVDDVLAIATSKSPTDRYPTAEAFALALQGAASGAAPIAVATAKTAKRTNPFKGLRAFAETDADEFRGRERLLEELVTRMRDPEFRLLAVVGPSGSGKSSVVRAGLIPAVRQGRVPGSSRWFISAMTPGSHPFESLETALLRVAVNPPGSLLDQLQDGPRGVLRSVQRVLPDDDGVLLLVVDQFEELFTANVSEAERDLFLRALTISLTDASTPVRVIVTLRADFYDRPLRHPAFAPLIKQTTVAIAPLAPDELERAIVGPAASAGVGFEAGLVAEIIADANSQPGALPLMQYALTAAFDRSSGATITIDDYRSIGGLTGALAQRAERIWQEASADEQAATRRLFERLVTLGEGREDTRRRVLRTELDGESSTDAMIERYGAARLLSFDNDATTREPTIEVSHEAVLREWPRLRECLDEDRDRLRIHRHLTAAANGWVESARDPGELYRGSRLVAAEALLAGNGVALNPLEGEFLSAGLKQRAELEATAQRRARRRRYLTVAIALIAALAVVASVVAVWQRDRANNQASVAERNAVLAADSASLADQRAQESDFAREDAEAERARADRAAAQSDFDREEAESARAAADLQRLEAQAVNVSESDPVLGALLAVEAHRISPSVTSLDALSRVFANTPGVDSRIPGAYGPSLLSSDGTRLAAIGDGLLDVWDLPTRTLIRRLEPGSEFEYDFRFDGAVVAVSDGAATYLLDVESGESGEVVGGTALALAFSPDGLELAVAHERSLQFWDVSTPMTPRLLEERATDQAVTKVAWNPAENAYALVTAEMTVEYWRRGDPDWSWRYEPPVGTDGHLGHSVTLFSNDGTTLVVAAGEGRGPTIVRTYSTIDGFRTPDIEERDLFGVVWDMAWIDEETGLVVASVAPSGGLTAFDLKNGTQMEPPFDAPWAWSVGHSRTLERYVTTGGAGIEIRRGSRANPLERVVPITPEQVQANGIVYAALSPDAQRLITGVYQPPVNPVTGTTSAAVFDLSQDPAPYEQPVRGGLPSGAGSFTLMIDLVDAVVLDAELTPLGPPVPTPPKTRWFHPSPDGRFFAAYSADGLVYLYRSSGELVAELRIPGAVPYEGNNSIMFSFSGDGSRIVGHLMFGNQRWAIWDTETGDVVDTGGPEVLGWPHFAGDTLYTYRGENDFMLVPRDRVTYEPIGPAFGGTSRIGSIVDDGKGELVATQDVQGFVRVYDTVTGTQIGKEIAGATQGDMQFAANGTTLMVIAGDHISLWNYDTATWPDVACQLAGRNLTRAEWAEFGPRTVEYRATCPQFPMDG
jgi:serine/threonine protein kinase/WD40 repeat protein/DNA-binding winged helix-turn-helix (wHTH) protein